jgi:hypothetical protein
MRGNHREIVGVEGNQFELGGHGSTCPPRGMLAPVNH